MFTEKTKSVFKKWLAFEKQHGDEEAAESVKQRAVSVFGTAVDHYVCSIIDVLFLLQIDYVQSLQSGGDDDED